MRLDTIEHRSNQSDERNVQVQDTGQNLMTPARRAALDALEREFRELLQSVSH